MKMDKFSENSSNRKCCCSCFNLRTGGKVLGIIYSVISSLVLIAGIVWAVFGSSLEYACFTVVVAATYLTVNVLFIVAIDKMMPNLVAFWLCFQAITITWTTMTAIFLLIKMSYYSIPFFIASGISVYLYICVENLQNLIDEDYKFIMEIREKAREDLLLR